MKFKLVENIDSLKEGTLVEQYSALCTKCGKNVKFDNDFYCPNCGTESYLQDAVVDNIEDINSKHTLIFNVDGVKKAIEGRIDPRHQPYGPNVVKIGVTQEFFDSLPVTIHDRTKSTDTRGGFKLDEVDPLTRQILLSLQDRARSYKQGI